MPKTCTNAKRQLWHRLLAKKALALPCFLPQDFARLVARHRQTGAGVTIVQLRAPTTVAAGLGVLTIDRSGNVFRIDEKPGKQAAKLAAQATNLAG